MYNVLDDVCFVCLGKVSRESISITIDPRKPIFGKTVKITCSFKVIPTPDYILYRNGTIITSNDGVVTETAKENGAINYTCKATNIFSTAARSDVVEVQGKIWFRTNLNVFVQKFAYIIWEDSLKSINIMS